MKQVLQRSIFGVLILARTCVAPLLGAAEPQIRATPYGLKLATQPGLLILTFETQQGRVRVYLPDELFPGESFSGTVEAMPAGASSATSSYLLQLADQQVVVRDHTFHWTVPTSRGTVPIVLSDFQHTELSRFDLAIRDGGPRRFGQVTDQFRIPGAVQSKAPLPVLGPFDGNSASTSFKLGDTVAEVLTEIPGKVMVLCRGELTGPVRYEVSKSARKSEGETRVLSIHLSGLPASLKNGKRSKLTLSVSGLAGAQQNAQVKLQVLTPTLVLIEAYAPISYFPHDSESIFIRPKDVAKDGTYTSKRVLQGIQPGAIEIQANLVMPMTPHDVVEQVLRTPRENYSKTPGQEHAEALKPFGERTLPLLADFLTEDFELAYASLEVMLLDSDRAAPLVIAAIPKMHQGQSVGDALRAYADLARNSPAFPYRRELHDAALSVLAPGGYLDAQRESIAAVFALGVVGSEADFQILEQVYHDQSETTTGNRLIRGASEASLARLGSQPHIANIKSQLGVVVKTTEDAANFEDGANSAIFTDNKEFIPLLCRHLGDPSRDFGDYGVSPANTAVGAITALLHKRIDGMGVEAECKVQRGD